MRGYNRRAIDRKDERGILMVHDSPGGTQEQYEQVGARLTDGRGLHSLSDWPVGGILSHTAGSTDNGWRVVDV
jgi:hypothetical protein